MRLDLDPFLKLEIEAPRTKMLQRTRSKRNQPVPDRGSPQAGPSQGAHQVPDRADDDIVDPDFGNFSKFHKAVLGVLVDRSLLDSVAVRDMFIQTCKACEIPFPRDAADYMNAVAKTMGTINSRIKKYDLLIKKISSGTSVESYYCLVTTSGASVNKMQEIYSDKELEFLHELINTIVDDERGYLSPLQACNVELPSKTSLTHSAAEDLLQMFELQNFVIRVKDKIMLGPRTLAELGSDMSNRNLDAFASCVLCQGIITLQGVTCDKCKKRCHPSCLIRQLDPEGEQGGGITCSNCMNPLPHDIVEKYRKMGLTKCEEREKEIREEEARQKLAEEMYFGTAVKETRTQRAQNRATAPMDVDEE